jgi:GntR family transcriptional regulator
VLALLFSGWVITRAMQILRIKEVTETLPGVGVFVREEASE